MNFKKIFRGIINKIFKTNKICNFKKMMQNLNMNLFNEIVINLLKNREIPFYFKNEKFNEEEKWKLDILKLLCYTDKKLSIAGLHNNNYSKTQIDSALSFIQKLACFNLENMISSYEPENYPLLKETPSFKVYFNSTNKVLIPFFLFLGYYSYLNKRKNNIKEIIQFQSNDYFDKSINLYINTKNLSLPQIINHYRKYYLLTTDKKNVIEEYEDKLEPEEFKLIFESYSDYKDLYLKGDSYLLINSLLSSISPKAKSIYLKNGKEYKIVNILINNLLEKIYDTFKYGFFDENEIIILINNLYEIIHEYMGYSIEINYIKFVVTYCNVFNIEEIKRKLDIICSFF